MRCNGATNNIALIRRALLVIKTQFYKPEAPTKNVCTVETKINISLINDLEAPPPRQQHLSLGHEVMFN